MGDPHDRRQFLKRSAVGAAALGLGACSRSWELNPDAGAKIAAVPKAIAMAAPSRLVQVQGAGVPKDLASALTRLLEPLGGMGAFVKKGQTVLLKPNMGFARPEHFRATTSAKLIAQVARQVLAQGASKVVVADYPVSDADEVIQSMGLVKALAGLDVHVVPISSDSEFVERDLPTGVEVQDAEYLKLALDADVHIALPIAKSHKGAGFTGALKGTMGLVKSRTSFHWLHDLHQAIVDINSFPGIKPHLTIMDGIEVMTTDGPQGPGELTRCDALIASSDPVAVDAAGIRLARLFGRKVKPKRIRHLALAQAAGIGRIDPPETHIQRIEMPTAP